MPADKKTAVNGRGYYSNAIVSDKVKDHGNNPFVVKKLKEAKALLLKNGLKGVADFKK